MSDEPNAVVEHAAESPDPHEPDPHQIARVVGISLAGASARIRAGHTGEQLWRKRDPRGPKRKPNYGEAFAEPQREPTTPVKMPVPPKLLMQADAIGFPRWLLQARFDAGWPVDHLFEQPRRWRRSKRVTVG